MTTSALDANYPGFVLQLPLPLPLPLPSGAAVDALRGADAAAWQREMSRAQLDSCLAQRTLPADVELPQALPRIGAVPLQPLAADPGPQASPDAGQAAVATQAVQATRSLEASRFVKAAPSAESTLSADASMWRPESHSAQLKTWSLDPELPAALPQLPAQDRNDSALAPPDLAGAAVLVQTVLGTQGLPHMMGLALEEVGPSSDVPAPQFTKAAGRFPAQTQPWAPRASSPSDESLVQTRPSIASAIHPLVPASTNSTVRVRAADPELTKAPSGVLPAVERDAGNSIGLPAPVSAPLGPAPLPVHHLTESDVKLVWSHSGAQPPLMMTQPADLSNHFQGELSANVREVSRGLILQQRPLAALDPFMASPSSSAAKRAFAAGTEGPAQAPIRGGSRSAPAEPVRVHAEWSSAGVRLWLGMDADMLAQADQISGELQRWLARGGVKVLSMACNGRLFVDYTRTKHGHHSD